MQRGVERTATTTCTPLVKMRVKALKTRLTMMKSCRRGVCCACSLSATSRKRQGRRASSRDARFFLDSAAGNHTQAPSVSGHTSQSWSSSHEGSHGAILRSCVRHGGAATAKSRVFQCCCWSTTRLPWDLRSNGSVASATCWMWSACSENASWAVIRVCTSAACPRAALRQICPATWAFQRAREAEPVVTSAPTAKLACRGEWFASLASVTVLEDRRHAAQDTKDVFVNAHGSE